MLSFVTTVSVKLTLCVGLVGSWFNWGFGLMIAGCFYFFQLA